MRRGETSTTSYALLGYLAIRPWTAYELAKQLGRTFHHFWPRAESGIYRDLKALVAGGLATAETEHVGRRGRTRYEITAQGHAALTAWLAEPASDGFLESVGLVRLLFSDRTETDTLLRLLEAMTTDAELRAAQMATVMRDYLVTGGQFPDRAHINVLVARFLIDFHAVVARWAEWSSAFIETWPDTTERPMDDQTRARIEQTIAAFDDGLPASGA